MTIGIDINVFGYRIGGIRVRIDFDDQPLDPVVKGKIVKGISRMWVKGLTA